MWERDFGKNENYHSYNKLTEEKNKIPFSTLLHNKTYFEFLVERSSKAGFNFFFGTNEIHDNPFAIRHCVLKENFFFLFSQITTLITNKFKTKK